MVDYLSYQEREKSSSAPKVTDSGTENASQEQLLRGLLNQYNKVLHEFNDEKHLHVADKADRRTQFDELVIGQEKSTFSLSSHWNGLELRNETEVSGSGSITNNDQGEYEIRTGTKTNSSASLTSKEAGIYEPGTSAIAGLGARITEQTSSYTASEEAKWGTYDSENGFGFGVDSTDFFVFTKRSGSVSKVHRDNFSSDSIRGDGPSGFSLDDFRDTHIFQVEYTWYGSGRIAFFLANRTEKYDLTSQNRILLHEYRPNEDDSFQGPSVLQPDLPFKTEVTNSGSSNDKGLAVTGRSFRRIDQASIEKTRSPVESLVDYSNLTEDQYKPVMALRKKDTFNGFPNQVNFRFQEANFSTDQNTSFRIEIGGDLVSGSTTFSEVDTWNSSSAVQISKGDNITLNSGAEGFVVAEEIIRGATNQGSSKKSSGDDELSVNIPIGRNEDLVVQARQDSSNTTTVSITISWTEAF